MSERLNHNRRGSDEDQLGTIKISRVVPLHWLFGLFSAFIVQAIVLYVTVERHSSELSAIAVALKDASAHMGAVDLKYYDVAARLYGIEKQLLSTGAELNRNAASIEKLRDSRPTR